MSEIAFITEGAAKIKAPEAVAGETKNAFFNPVQTYNRDTSIAAIRTWSEIFAQEKRSAWEKKRQNKKRKLENGKSQNSALDNVQAPPPFKFNVFEGLAATGLRSIRYAKEIPLLKTVMANDLSSSAVESMKENLVLNELPLEGPAAKVQVNEGDCCAVMYQHRTKNKFDCIDLDPYGTASPFIDGAVQAVAEGGLLCITCTDAALLAGTNYPEKTFANYGGLPVKAEYCHEVGLRLILHLLSTNAAKYGRYIKPLLSLSIDFYFRVFVRVYTGANQVKSNLPNTGTIHVCQHCQNHVIQPFGKAKQSGNNVNYRFASGLPHTNACEQCESSMKLGGPMWLGPLHDPSFVEKMLTHLDTEEANYHTKPRMKGMLTLAQNELTNPLYFTPGRLAGSFKTTCPSLAQFCNALKHLGYKVSRSHALSGSLKTDAPNHILYDIFRSWAQLHPIVRSNIPENSPALKINDKTKTCEQEIDFSTHPETSATLMTDVKLVRYQMNPEPNFGPQKRATLGKAKSGEAGSKKRKQPEPDVGSVEAVETAPIDGSSATAGAPAS